MSSLSATRPTKFKVKMIPNEKIYIDETIQRTMKDSTVRKIVEDFSWAYAKPLTVWYNKQESTYMCCDGQHTLQAQRIKFGEKLTHVECIVTTEKPHKVFIAINKHQRPITQKDTFWANHAGGESEENTVFNMCKKRGIDLVRGKVGKYNQTNNVHALLSSYRKNPVRFALFLDILSNYFGEDGSAYAPCLESAFMFGVAKFLLTSKHKENKIRDRLAKNKPPAETILAKAAKNANNSEGRKKAVVDQLTKIMAK